MKVVFLARALGPGGAERQLAVMAAGLQRRGHEVTVATFYPGGAFLPIIAEAGVHHVSLEKTGRWDVVGFLFRLRALLKQHRPDVLYSLLPPANIIAACCTPRIAGMHRVWGIRVSDMDLSHYDWLERLSYALETRLAGSADLIIFNSESGCRRAMSRGMSNGRTVVIANGIDTERFSPDDAVRRIIRDSWGVGASDYVVGMVGRFDPMKDHRGFVAAAAMLLKMRANTRFVLAGAGVDTGNSILVDMLEAVGLSDRTLLLGERKDMPKVMAGFDILCLSSAFGEGFPNVLGEAMATGVPCVSTDVGDSRAIVGETGEIVPPGEPEKLAHAMAALLTRLDQTSDSLQDAARSRIAGEFSLKHLIDRTEACLARLGEVDTGMCGAKIPQR